MGIFDITKKKTWRYASQTERMVWKGDVFYDIDSGRPISEMAMMNFMLESDIKIMESTIVEKKHKYGDKKIITYIMDNLAKGIDTDKILTDVIKDINNAGIFDIFNFDSWEFAGDKLFLWNGKKLVKKDNNPFTEKDTVDLVSVIFKFLERKGDIIPHDEKIKAIKNLLNRMENPEYYAQQYEQEQAEIDNAIPDDKFNPRYPETYKFAKNKPLIIDGVRIFNISYDKNNKKINEGETEKGFVTILSALLKMQKNAIIWETAVSHVKPDFINQGKEPNQETHGYIEKTNEVYNSMLKNPNARLAKKQEKEYIEKHIKQKIAECSHRK